MTWEWITTKRPVERTPPEAPAIASRLRAEAQRAREVATWLRSTGGAIDANWEGNAHLRFMAEYRLKPGDVESFIAWLEGTARRIEGMKVTVWEEVRQQVWVPDPGG